MADGKKKVFWKELSDPNILNPIRPSVLDARFVYHSLKLSRNGRSIKRCGNTRGNNHSYKYCGNVCVIFSTYLYVEHFVDGAWCNIAPLTFNII